jgi:uncharacterized protein
VIGPTSRVLVWQGLGAWRAELCEAHLHPDRLLARGVQLGVEPLPYRLQYTLDTGSDFVTARLTVDASGAGWSRRVDLTRGAEGTWSWSADARGEPGLPDPGGDPSAVAGALDCDLANSPLTNTMPVLREGLLDGGEPRDFVMAWVSVPDLSVHRSEQRYEPIDGTTVRYVSAQRDFVAELQLDTDGFVVRYPELGERVAP